MNEPAPKGAALHRQKKAQHNLIGIGIFLALLGVAYWYVHTWFSLPLTDVASFESQVSKSLLNTVAENISTPPPLKVASKPKSAAPTAVKPAALTTAGIIVQTNTQRSVNGNLPPLKENPTLDSIASLRLDDMFAKQYFAHVAPDGGSATTVAKTVGYSYLSLGENLALGNFTSDNDVVTAWMNSPGHRANILGSQYTEIGVAARKGTFDGETTWIAVQVFGRPSSDCPSPDPALKTSIDSNQAQLTQLNSDLAQKKAAIDAMQPQYGDAYNQKVSEYNAEVAQYNALAEQVKTEVAQYNSEVQSFNACLSA